MNRDLLKILNLDKYKLNIENIDTIKMNETLYINIKLKNNHDYCPSCNCSSCKVNDYYTKKIKHSISNNNPCYIIYKARRFYCPVCKGTFLEKNPFAKKGSKISHYTISAVLKSLKCPTNTFAEVAKKFNLSTTKVIQIFDKYIDTPALELPEVLCMDEFYTSQRRIYKYAFIMYDFEKRQIIDIYCSRHSNYLDQCLSRLPLSELKKVKLVIIDMWKAYKDVSLRRFPNCKIAVDSFHVIKNLNACIDSIRISVMNKFNKKTDKLDENNINYYLLKKYHYFFTKNFESIYDGLIPVRKLKTSLNKHEILNYLLDIDDDLKKAFYLKETYREFNLTATYENCDEELEYLIDEFLNSKFECYREFGKLLLNWKEEIKNSFIRHKGRRISNGPIEGVNSRIKKILKNGNGYKNFFRLRSRIMYSLNDNKF